jgi:hypothetical protein
MTDLVLEQRVWASDIRKSVAQNSDLGADWVEAQQTLDKAADEIALLRAKIAHAGDLLTEGAPALALEALQTTEPRSACLHCDLRYPMSADGMDHVWCDVTGTKDFSARCANVATPEMAN